VYRPSETGSRVNLHLKHRLAVLVAIRSTRMAANALSHSGHFSFEYRLLVNDEVAEHCEVVSGESADELVGARRRRDKGHCS